MNQDIYAVIEHLQNQVTEISFVIIAAARELAKYTSGEVVGVLMGHDSQGLASNLAVDRVLYIDDPNLAEFTSDAYQKVLSIIINDNNPQAVLFGNTSIGADLASVLSARMDLSIVNSCQSISPEGKLVSKICGGKIMTETDVPNSPFLATVIPGGYKPELGQSEVAPDIVQVQAPQLEDLRVILKHYIPPEAGDVDISKETILVSVGRGISNIDNIELAEELAAALGGVVSASRPVVDQGWLPTTRMVGKSGKSVKAKLYLAFGISGAPEHLEGMADSETIIAFNTDPTAPIFDAAQYGAEVDILDLFEVLTEKVQEAKGG